MEGVVSPGGRVDRFSLAVGSALLALMAGLRILSGAGLGLHPGEEGAVPSGFLFNALDNLSYASWAQQSAQGRLLFENLYTTEAHGRILFNVFFLLAGGIARFTGWAVSGTITLLGALGAFATLVVGLHAARALGNIGHMAANPALTAAMQDADARVRLAAVSSWLQLLHQADAAPVDSSTPSRIILRAPPCPSSPGWKHSTTSRRSASRLADSIVAAPSNIAVWPS